jgi:hypothetical protein
MSNRLHLLVFCLALKDSRAWGPIYEPLKGGLFGGGFARTAAFLEATSGRRSHKGGDRGRHPERGDRSSRSLRENLERTFDLCDSSHHEDIFSSPEFLVSDASGLLDELVGYQEMSLESSSPPPYHPCSGEECDSEEHDCAIPEEYKTLSDEAVSDVLAFLGIRRAEPLRVYRQAARDWE